MRVQYKQNHLIVGVGLLLILSFTQCSPLRIYHSPPYVYTHPSFTAALLRDSGFILLPVQTDPKLMNIALPRVDLLARLFHENFPQIPFSVLTENVVNQDSLIQEAGRELLFHSEADQPRQPQSFRTVGEYFGIRYFLWIMVKEYYHLIDRDKRSIFYLTSEGHVWDSQEGREIWHFQGTSKIYLQRFSSEAQNQLVRANYLEILQHLPNEPVAELLMPKSKKW